MDKGLLPLSTGPFSISFVNHLATVHAHLLQVIICLGRWNIRARDFQMVYRVPRGEGDHYSRLGFVFRTVERRLVECFCRWPVMYPWSLGV